MTPAQSIGASGIDFHLIAAKAETADLVLVDTAGFGNRAASVDTTSADAVLIPGGAGEANVTEAENTMQLVGGLARAARREIPSRLVFNRSRRTSLAKHAAGEVRAANLPRLDAELADRVAYGEMSFTGRLPSAGPAAEEIESLIVELAKLGWITLQPHVKTQRRKARRHEGT